MKSSYVHLHIVFFSAVGCYVAKAVTRKASYGYRNVLKVAKNCRQWRRGAKREHSRDTHPYCGSVWLHGWCTRSFAAD